MIHDYPRVQHPIEDEYLKKTMALAMQSLPEELPSFLEVGPFDPAEPGSCVYARVDAMTPAQFAAIIGRAIRRSLHYHVMATTLSKIAFERFEAVPPMLSIEEMAKLPLDDDWTD